MVGQPLAFDALDRGFGAVNVAAPKTDAVIVTEIKLCEMTVQVPVELNREANRDAHGTVGFIWRTDRPKSSFAGSFIHG